MKRKADDAGLEDSSPPDKKAKLEGKGEGSSHSSSPSLDELMKQIETDGGQTDEASKHVCGLLWVGLNRACSLSMDKVRWWWSRVPEHMKPSIKECMRRQVEKDSEVYRTTGELPQATSNPLSAALHGNQRDVVHWLVAEFKLVIPVEFVRQMSGDRLCDPSWWADVRGWIVSKQVPLTCPLLKHFLDHVPATVVLQLLQDTAFELKHHDRRCPLVHWKIVTTVAAFNEQAAIRLFKLLIPQQTRFNTESSTFLGDLIDCDAQVVVQYLYDTGRLDIPFGDGFETLLEIACNAFADKLFAWLLECSSRMITFSASFIRRQVCKAARPDYQFRRVRDMSNWCRIVRTVLELACYWLTEHSMTIDGEFNRALIEFWTKAADRNDLDVANGIRELVRTALGRERADPRGSTWLFVDFMHAFPEYRHAYDLSPAQIEFWTQWYADCTSLAGNGRGLWELMPDDRAVLRNEYLLRGLCRSHHILPFLNRCRPLYAGENTPRIWYQLVTYDKKKEPPVHFDSPAFVTAVWIDGAGELIDLVHDQLIRGPVAQRLKKAFDPLLEALRVPGIVRLVAAYVTGELALPRTP